MIQGISFHSMKRCGKCYHCGCAIVKGEKSVVLGSLSNEFRYCVNCFITVVEEEFSVEIKDFINLDREV